MLARGSQHTPRGSLIGVDRQEAGLHFQVRERPYKLRTVKVLVSNSPCGRLVGGADHKVIVDIVVVIEQVVIHSGHLLFSNKSAVEWG